MKKGLMCVGLSIIASIFIGCGDGDLDTKDLKYEQKNIFDEVALKPINYKSYEVNAVDDPIIHAKVEAKECNSSEELGDGKYRLIGCISKPSFISITDGIMISKDENGKEINITQSFPLLLNTQQIQSDVTSFVVTPLTTIVATAEDNNSIEKIANKLGLNKEDLFKDPREVDSDVNASEIALKVNNILIQAAENGSVVNKVKFIDTVKNKIKEVEGNGKDLNFSKVAQNVNTIAQKDPDFFGFVMIPTKKVESKDILVELEETQHPKELHFAGFVFDENFEANISIYKQDGEKIEELNVTTDENGYWVIKDENSKLYNIIYETNQTLIFEAVKNNDSDIVLRSTITTPRLRKLLEKQKRVTASKDNALIISNVTTAEYAVLNKRGVFNTSLKDSVQAYENNKTDINIYYSDEVLKASATIKAVVDKGEDLGEADDTIDLAIKAFDEKGNFDLSKTEVDKKVEKDMEKNITNSSILKTQLNRITTVLDNKRITMEDIVKQANYTFYRLFAYKLDNGEGELVREYEKFVLVPGGVEYKKYQIIGDEKEWNLIDEKNSTEANFKNGNFIVTLDNSITEFSLDKNSTFYVKDLNKNYNYYSIIETQYETDGITIDTRTPVIWVDDYDVVDGFRRLNDKDKNKLENNVDGLNKDEVNSKLNRYVRDFLNNVSGYFK